MFLVSKTLWYQPGCTYNAEKKISGKHPNPSTTIGRIRIQLQSGNPLRQWDLWPDFSHTWRSNAVDAWRIGSNWHLSLKNIGKRSNSSFLLLVVRPTMFKRKFLPKMEVLQIAPSTTVKPSWPRAIQCHHPMFVPGRDYIASEFASEFTCSYICCYLSDQITYIP